jgi:hypothetical protein
MQGVCCWPVWCLVDCCCRLLQQGLMLLIETIADVSEAFQGAAAVCCLGWAAALLFSVL